ncbi:MAG: DnaJ domain-containing protein [Gammaproteobacteria bacterium]|nr:DnaJ domain-containing protein [Gammaproteobacteria bacterium]MCY4198384.1 DnaJ domain-containing protein [Gammaproteobacteria bacterium]MCY4278840.1 DnaJ domain-containing protein [Gammaproteobacteria bacterium]MCY4323838.1 DnaJ domain-containing protein [Gammaproteobacteria bacterium]
MMLLVLIVILGTVAALAVRYFVLRTTHGAPNAFKAGQGATWALAIGLTLGLVALFFSGRVHWLAPILGGLAPLVVRFLPRLFQRFRAGQFGADTSADGRTSEVRSAWLRMTLDHDSGHMEGEILLGEHAGQFLSELDFDALMALREEIEDSDSLRLFDAWLDRHHQDWRSSGEGGQRRGADSEPDIGSGSMTRPEALRILGLGEDATDDEIRTAYKQLMQKLHPDLGGSDYLASVVNRAKQVLLGS